jgi:hypothetical protein
MKKYIALFNVLLISTAANANVIFPAFSAPYVTEIFFPIALVSALAVEAVTYKLIDKSLTIPSILVLVAIVNTLSWVIGIIITNQLPSGLIVSGDILTTGPNFSFYATLGFIVAYILSVIIEGGALMIASRKATIRTPLKLS